MACTTILVGKNASYDGSTMIARNDDSGAGRYTPKKVVVYTQKDLSTTYTTVISKTKITCPKNALSFTAVPNALKGEGLWAACGINSENVAMTATETITTNARVLGADPLMRITKDSTSGGIGEEDLVMITLPYIHSAREGVLRLGKLLETYGTYESNGIAFSDHDEIWWFETIGGHHWMARKVPDDAYVVMPNQLGLDKWDWDDAMGYQENFLCSKDLRSFVEKNHLDLSLGQPFNPRDAFGSHEDADHIYNTPRAWYMLRYFNPTTYTWDGPNADYTPTSDFLPWSLVPEKKITVEDIKYILSSHFQDTPYDPYGKFGEERGMYRSIGVNRTDLLGLMQIRPEKAEDSCSIHWIALGSNVFNILVPLYTQVSTIPEYLANTTATVDTNNFYWSMRLIGALADASYRNSLQHIERYQLAVASKANAIINKYDAKLAKEKTASKRKQLRQQANQEIVDMVQQLTDATLDKVLWETSNQMKNAFARSDA